MRGSSVVAGVAAMLALMLAGPATAQEPYTFQDWQVTNFDAGVMAGTENDSGHVLAKVCYSESQTCYWAIGTQLSCQKGTDVPVLLASESGARHANVKCFGRLSDIYMLFFSDYALVDGVSQKDNAVSIAFPVEGNSFRVMRFSLRGSQQAAQLAELAVAEQKKNSTRDVSL